MYGHTKNVYHKKPAYVKYEGDYSAATCSETNTRIDPKDNQPITENAELVRTLKIENKNYRNQKDFHPKYVKRRRKLSTSCAKQRQNNRVRNTITIRTQPNPYQAIFGGQEYAKSIYNNQNSQQFN